MQSSISIQSRKKAASRDRNYWQEIVKKFDASNEHANTFCESRNINVGTLAHWRSVFKKEKKQSVNKFVEVKVIPSSTPFTGFRIECPSGHKIIFSGDASLEETQRMFKLLGMIA